MNNPLKMVLICIKNKSYETYIFQDFLVIKAGETSTSSGPDHLFGSFCFRATSQSDEVTHLGLAPWDVPVKLGSCGQRSLF